MERLCGGTQRTAAAGGLGKQGARRQSPLRAPGTRRLDEGAGSADRAQHPGSAQCGDLDGATFSPLAHAVEWIARDCERLAPRFDEGGSVLRYEEKFFDDRASVERIGRMIALPIDPALEATIFAHYRREAVRNFAARITELPPERLGGWASSTWIS